MDSALLVALVADDSVYGIGVAVVIAIGGFAYTVYSGIRSDRRSTLRDLEAGMNERISDLKSQVDELKQDNAECARQRKELERENLQLMRELVRRRNGGT